jgi:hypothetical protein
MMKMKKGVILFILSILVSLSIGQSKPKLKFDEGSNSYNCSEKFDSLFLISSSTAISAYPELQKISIHYKIGNLKTIMAARPLFMDIFRRRDKREYQILLSNNELNNCNQIFCQIPEQALTGILGHELAHLLTYNNKTSIQLIFYAFKYLLNKKEIERETDMITIQRGFGKNLIDYNLFILNSNLVSKQYLKNRYNNYLSVNEIQDNLHR